MTQFAGRAATPPTSHIPLRSFLRCSLLALATVALAGCETVNMGFPGPGQPTPEPRVEALGEGSVTVALLLPTSASGGAGETARAMRNAAELALDDIPNSDLRIVPLDSQGDTRGAESATRRALEQDASMVIGPLLAGEVRGAGSVAYPAEVPVIAFSSDANVAAPGVYLLSFLPQADVERIVSYSVRNGNRTFAALLPEGSYGEVVEAALQQSAARHNGRIAAIERYGTDENDIRAAIRRIAAVAGGADPQVDALLVPDTPSAMARLAPMLAEANIDTEQVRLLGSGQWNDQAAWRIDGLAGGWFVGPEPGGWQSFQARYEERYGSSPPRNATLAYDAVSLAAALAGHFGAAGFTRETLTDSDGFAGVDGVFRFRTDGTNERGLAVLEIEGGTARVRDRAPANFGPGT